MNGIIGKLMMLRIHRDLEEKKIHYIAFRPFYKALVRLWFYLPE